MIGTWGVELELGDSLPWRPIEPGDDLSDLSLCVISVECEVPPEVLIESEEISLPVVVVVKDLQPWALRNLYLKYSCIRNLVVYEEFSSLDLAAVLEQARQTVSPGRGFMIGSDWLLPADPDEYESWRFLSLNSPAMAPFLSELRAAIGQMRRRRPPIPWDPADQLAPPTLDKEGCLKGRGPFNLSDLVAHAREDDVRSILFAQADRTHWESLPPPLLVLGESGTGKSLLAGLIHEVLTEPPTDDGRRGQLVEVAVAGADVRNLDYELFGATVGTYSGVSFRVGAATQAAYGTLFLDEIGDMPHDAQTRLLRFFNDLRIRVEGTAQPFFSYMQIVAATNRDVDYLVSMGGFRNDLLARFRTRVTLPPLRTRGPDELRRQIDFVAQNPNVNPQTARNRSGEGARVVSHIALEALEALTQHEYRDGNFRELENAVHTAIWRARGSNRRTIELGDIELSTPHYHPDRLRRVVQVKRLPPHKDAIEVGELGELLRIAERKDSLVLRCGDVYVGFADGAAFRVQS